MVVAMLGLAGVALAAPLSDGSLFMDDFSTGDFSKWTQKFWNMKISDEGKSAPAAYTITGYEGTGTEGWARVSLPEYTLPSTSRIDVKLKCPDRRVVLLFDRGIDDVFPIDIRITGGRWRLRSRCLRARDRRLGLPWWSRTTARRR